jgi:hypothetical protein
MHLSFLLALTMAAIGSLATYHKKPLQYPPGGPSSIEEFREKYPYNPKTFDRHRRVVTIHPSRNDLDDVSAAFDEGLRNANHGGTLYLPTNETFVIGKPLDLTFLTMSKCASMERYSLPMTRHIGKQMPSVTPFKAHVCFGSGAAKMSKSMVRELLMEMAKSGGTKSGPTMWAKDLFCFTVKTSAILLWRASV